MTCENICAPTTCDEHAAAPEVRNFSRRGALKSFAGLVAAVGLSTLGDAAFAAAKTYTACKTTDIAVGKAKLVTLPGTSKTVIITRPKSTTYKAFSPRCTHENVQLSGVSGSNLVCNQHGARFSTTTGAATAGPTRRALTSYKVTISGTSVKVTV
jgi:nitrite reductase/ring-hydroxylating ferredoxin subunit